MALFYADASALVKLVRGEPESEALRAFVDDADLVCCELALAELPRAIRRAAADDPRLPLEALIARAGELLEAVALLPLDRDLLAVAGALAEPALGRWMRSISPPRLISHRSMRSLATTDCRAPPLVSPAAHASAPLIDGGLSDSRPNPSRRGFA